MKRSGTLVQLCKAPIPGKVKTRLTPFLSNEQAGLVHRQLALYIFNRLVHSPIFETVDQINPKLKYQLWIDQQHDFFEDWPNSIDYPVLLQQGDSLGDRLKFAAKNVLEHSDFVIFIGSDCPFISSEDLKHVTVALDEGNDLVIIPADDGGYVLIAIKKVSEVLFDDIDWGSEKVLTQTLMAAGIEGLVYHLMNSKPDIDRPEDLALLDELNDFSCPIPPLISD